MSATVTAKVHRIAKATGLDAKQVLKVLEAADAHYEYPPGTVVRAYEGANMAMRTENGWVRIPNTTFRPEGWERDASTLSGWQVVYNPDAFDHQRHVFGDGYEVLP